MPQSRAFSSFIITGIFLFTTILTSFAIFNVSAEEVLDTPEATELQQPELTDPDSQDKAPEEVEQNPNEPEEPSETKEQPEEEDNQNEPQPEKQSTNVRILEAGTKRTFQNIQLNTVYKYPLDQRVKIEFTKLDETIETPEFSFDQKTVELDGQKVNGFEIKSNMRNGEFEYNLTLPNPTNSTNAQVKYSENGKDFEEIVEKTVGLEEVKLKKMDHFTIFVVTTPNPVSSDCSDASVGVVGTDECYNSIQEAVDAATPGDTIEVTAGTYNENVIVNKSISLIAEPGTIIDGGGSGSGISVQTGNVTIDGFEIQNTRCNGIVAGYPLNTTAGHWQNIQILNNTIHDVDGPSIGCWGFGLYLGYEGEGFGGGSLSNHLDFSGLIVSGNEIYNTANAAVVLQSISSTGTPLQVNNNNLHDSNASGIWIDTARNIDITNNNIENNNFGVYISSIGDESLYGPENISINRNTIQNNNNQEVWNTTGSTTINAEENFWGSANGPAGGEVVGLVAVCPWLDAPGGNLTGDCFGFIQGRTFIDQGANGRLLTADGDYPGGMTDGFTVRLYDDSWTELDEITTNNTGNIGQYRFDDVIANNTTYYVCGVGEFGYNHSPIALGQNPTQTDGSAIQPQYAVGTSVANQSSADDESGVCWQVTLTDSQPDAAWLGIGYVEFLEAPQMLGWNEDNSDPFSDPRPNTEIACGGFTTVNGASNHWTEVTGNNVKYQRQYQRPNQIGTNNWSGNEIFVNPYTNYRTFGGNPGQEGTYNSRVRAFVDTNGNNLVDADELTSEWSDECSITYDNTPPERPQMVSITNQSGNLNLICSEDTVGYTGGTSNADREITITWEPSTDPNIDFYYYGVKGTPKFQEVEHRTDGGGNLEVYEISGGGRAYGFDGTHFYFRGLMNNDPDRNPFWYSVIAVDKAGNESALENPLTDEIDKSLIDNTCGNVILGEEPTAEIFWLKVEMEEGELITNGQSMAGRAAESDTWTATVRDEDGNVVRDDLGNHGTPDSQGSYTVDIYQEDFAGTYDHVQVIPGIYELEENVQDGYQLAYGRCLSSTATSAPSSGGLKYVFGPRAEEAGFNNPSNADFATFELVEDERLYCVVFNEPAETEITGTISGRKYLDKDLDGQHDLSQFGNTPQAETDEEMLGGWTINLYNQEGNVVDSQVTTDSGYNSGNGSFAFQDVPEGTYYVCEEQQENWLQTAPVLGQTNDDQVSWGSGAQGVATAAEFNDGLCWQVEINENNQSVNNVKFGNVESGDLRIRKLECDENWFNQNIGTNLEGIRPNADGEVVIGGQTYSINQLDSNSLEGCRVATEPYNFTLHYRTDRGDQLYGNLSDFDQQNYIENVEINGEQTFENIPAAGRYWVWEVDPDTGNRVPDDQVLGMACHSTPANSSESLTNPMANAVIPNDGTGDCVVFNQVQTTNLEVCKEDTEGTPLDDWWMDLGQVIETVEVDSSSRYGTEVTLPSGFYTMQVSGTFEAGDGITADARYSSRNGGQWQDLVENYEIYPNILNLQVGYEAGGAPFYFNPILDPVTYNPTHTYTATLFSDGTPIHLRINDDLDFDDDPTTGSTAHANNVGSLEVKIIDITHSQLTGDGSSTNPGCTLFEDLLVGEYTLSEFPGTFEYFDWEFVSRSDGGQNGDSIELTANNERITFVNQPIVLPQPELEMQDITINEVDDAIPDVFNFVVSSDPGFLFCWYDDIPPTPNQVDNDSTYTVICLLEDSFGQIVEVSATLTILNNPPEITGGTQTDTTVIATISNGNPALSYSWGGGCTGNTAIGTKPTTPGTYNCTLTVTDSDGDTDTAVFEVIIPATNPGGGGNPGGNTNPNPNPGTTGGNNPGGGFVFTPLVTSTPPADEEEGEEEPEEEVEEEELVETEPEPIQQVLGAQESQEEEVDECGEEEFPWWIVLLLILAVVAMVTYVMIDSGSSRRNEEDAYDR